MNPPFFPPKTFPTLPFHLAAPTAGAELASPEPAAGDLLDLDEQDRFLYAVNRIHLQRLEIAARSACGGCSHSPHKADSCEAIPLFTNEARCRCWEEA